MSIPFFNEEFTFHQPDGSELRVRGSGDENSAIFETLDGFTVVRNPVSGFYEFAVPSPIGDEIVPSGVHADAVSPSLLNLHRHMRPSPEGLQSFSLAPSRLPPTPMRWEIRRERRRNQLRAAAASDIMPAPPERQTVGTFVGLCLLIQFPDVPGTISRDEVDDYCNKRGYSGFSNKGSVFDYFHDVSGGKLKFTHIVAPYYTTRHPRAYYTNPQIPYGTRAREMILEALAFHLQNGLDFSALSADEDGFVFATSVFYAGTGVNNWSEGLWPHAHHLSSPVQLAPGKSAHDYQVTDMTAELSLGTFCHETGHLLCDFPDLYDKVPFKSSGIGTWCLMCAGNHADKKNPTKVGAYLRHAAGWIDEVVDIEPGAELTLRADKNEFAVFRKNAGEYFILENRAKTGRDAALPGEGLAIWHVDEVDGSNNNQQRTPTKHFECALMQADGDFHLENGNGQGDASDLFRAGLADAFSGQTTPNSAWWNGSASGLHVSNISAAGVSMSFKVAAGPEAQPGDTVSGGTSAVA